MTETGLQEIEKHIELARQECMDICHLGSKRWRMSIPAKDTDTDVVFVNLIKDTERLLGHVRSLVSVV